MRKNESERKDESISARKWKQIKSEAADLGIAPEEHLLQQIEKELSDLTKKYSTSLTKSQQIAALNWAAEKANTTYGKLVSTLTVLEKADIFRQYEKYLVEREAAEEEKAKELRAIARRIKETEQ